MKNPSPYRKGDLVVLSPAYLILITWASSPLTHDRTQLCYYLRESGEFCREWIYYDNRPSRREAP